LRSKYYDQLTSYEVIFPEPVSILNQKYTKKFNIIVEFNSNENKNFNKDFEKFKVIKFEKNKIQSQIWPLRTKVVTQQVENSYLYKFDISLPLNNWSIFLNAVKIFHKDNASYEPYFFGHLGDGNLHCNYKINNSNKKKYQKLENFIYQLVIKLGGSIAAEHGLGYSKNHLIKKYKSREHFEILNKIKSLFDKDKLLNRNKLIKS
jgi:FAD/FMN-containing dehydrogenase